MKNTLRFSVATIIASVTTIAFGGTSATGTIDNVSFTGGLYTYDLTLTNTGTTNIGTFWYSWTPGQDYMPATPTNVMEPSTWTLGAITGSGNSSDGKAIQWLATTPLAAGASISGFSFESTAAPSAIFGDSVSHPGVPVGTSFVYQNGPFSGGSEKILVQAVPEPCSMVVIASSIAVFVRRRRLSA